MFFSKLSLSLFAVASAISGAVAQYNGQATYYYQNGVAGACGVVHSDYDLIVAISVDQFDSSLCGSNVWLFNPANSATFTVTVADICEGCGYGDIDLSVGAFEELSEDGLGPGVLYNIDWNYY